MNVFDEIFLDEKPKKDAQNKNDTQKVIFTLDPRSDITSDHHHWELILHNAKALFNTPKPVNDAGPSTLFAILHGLRCAGAKIEETKQAYKLLPGEEEFVDPAEWEATKRRWLDPVKDDLVSLFKQCKIGRVVDVDKDLPEDVAELFARGETGQGEHDKYEGKNNDHKQQNLNWR
jgi:hypothetical protein